MKVFSSILHCEPKKILKKTYFFFLFALIFAVLVFFRARPLFPQSPVTVTVLVQGGESAFWQPLADRFEGENPGIRLDIIEGPNETDLVEDLYTSSFILGRSPYDLVYMDIIWVPKFAAAGWLLPLSDRMTEEELSKFLKGDVEGGIYRNELYRIPFRSDAGMLYYRTDLLAEGGLNPPETFSQLEQVAQTLQDRGKVDWGYLWQGKQYEGLSAMFVEILAGYGGFWVDPDALEVGLDRPEAIAAISFLLETLERGISPPGTTTYAEEDTRRLFQNGKAALLRNWPYVFGLASTEGSPIRGRFAIKPMVHAPGWRSGACQGGWGLGIAASSPHPDAAWKVIEFMASEASQRDFALRTSYAPTLRSLYGDPQLLTRYPYFPELLGVLERSVLRPSIAQYAQASDILQRYLSAALTKRMAARAAMQNAARETRDLLRNVQSEGESRVPTADNSAAQSEPMR